jgi:hypothetical protein
MERNTLGDVLLLGERMGNTNDETRMLGNRQVISVVNKMNKMSIRDKKLLKYRWGVGIEHEMQLFHNPYMKMDISKSLASKKIDDSHIIFDSLRPTIKLLKNPKEYSQLTSTDHAFLDSVPFEPSGRKCSGEYVLEKVPVGMPEFITTNPFSSLDHNPKQIEDYCDEIIGQERKFIQLMMLDDLVVKQVNKYGTLASYPFGMSNYIKVPTESSRLTDTYRYKKKLYEDYTGSYHITLTLPYDKTRSEEKQYKKEFIKNHQQFANQFQWLEPLLLVGFFSSDQKSMGTADARIRGSFRLMRTGWGNLATSDVRKFKTGIGRYANIKAHWRKGLEFKDLDKLKYCNKVSIPEPGAVSALGANFRTFGSTDPLRPWHRESGIGMTVPNGIEIRIFDHFPQTYIKDLCRIIIYIAENSRVHTTNRYVYKNTSWIKATQEVMKQGWKAILPIGYVKELRKNLGLKINTKSLRACDILNVVNIELFKKNRNGDYAYLMTRNRYKINNPPNIPNINRNSWEYGFLIKLINTKTSLNKKFFKLLKELPLKTTITPVIFSELFYKSFDKALWKNNIEDIMYFLQTYDVLTNNLKVVPKNIKILANSLQEHVSKPFIQRDIRPSYTDILSNRIGKKLQL